MNFWFKHDIVIKLEKNLHDYTITWVVSCSCINIFFDKIVYKYFSFVKVVLILQVVWFIGKKLTNSYHLFSLALLIRMFDEAYGGDENVDAKYIRVLWNSLIYDYQINDIPKVLKLYILYISIIRLLIYLNIFIFH